MHLKNGTPVWVDGDVVKIRFTRKRDANPADGLMLSDVYEYVRYDGYWPGDGKGWWSDKSDFDMTKAWGEGRAAVMEMVEPPAPTTENMPLSVALRRHHYEMTTRRWIARPNPVEFTTLILTHVQRDQLLLTAERTEITFPLGTSEPGWRGMGILVAPLDVPVIWPETHLDCRGL